MAGDENHAPPLGEHRLKTLSSGRLKIEARFLFVIGRGNSAEEVDDVPGVGTEREERALFGVVL